MKKSVIIILMLHFVSIIVAQNCYRETRKEAISAFGQKNFRRAKQIFNAARSCPDIPESNDLAYWMNRCDKANNPKTQKKELSFAQKMNLYVSDGDWSEGLMAVASKKDWEKHDPEIENSPLIGFINESGDIVIKRQFLESGFVNPSFGLYVNRFSEGVSAVYKYSGVIPWKMGFIDERGNTIIPFNFCGGTCFSEGLAAVVSECDAFLEGNKPCWYFIDKRGNSVFAEQFWDVGLFSEGMCVVMKDTTGLYGYINRKGIMVIPGQFIDAKPFKGGLAYVRTKSSGYKYVQINKQGVIVGQSKFKPEYLFDSQIIEAIKSEIKAFNYLSSFELCRESEKLEGRENLKSFIAYAIGQHFYHGWVVSKDQETAKKYFTKAVDYSGPVLGYAKEAYSYLGTISYAEGDYMSSMKYYNLCLNLDKKFCPALYNIGLLYYYGQGVPQDYRKALFYFEECIKYGFKKEAGEMIEICKTKI